MTLMTREEVLKDIRACLQRSIRLAYEDDGRAFTERDLREAEYTILSELARSHQGMRRVKPLEVSREVCGNE